VADDTADLEAGRSDEAHPRCWCRVFSPSIFGVPGLMAVGIALWGPDMMVRVRPRAGTRDGFSRASSGGKGRGTSALCLRIEKKG